MTLDQDHLLSHLQILWVTLLDRFSIRQLKSANKRMRRGFALMHRNNLLQRDSESVTHLRVAIVRAYFDLWSLFSG